MATMTVGQRADGYSIAGGEDGKRRLDLLADVMRPSTLELLARVDLRPGWRCLDLGCGGGHVAIELARRVGPAGHVTGVDFDADIIRLARLDAARAGVACDLRVGDCRDRIAAGPFDLTYARFLLSHVSAPTTVLARAAEVTRPGGVIAVEDIDFTGFLCWPPSRAYDRYVDLYREIVRRGGGDADLGRRLPWLLHDTGLVDVRVTVAQPIHTGGIGKHLNRITMERIRATVLRHGLSTEPELDQIVDDMHAYAEDPTTIVSCPRIVQAWGTVAA
jgi:SAM-dependent methyltransferase